MLGIKIKKINRDYWADFKPSIRVLQRTVNNVISWNRAIAVHSITFKDTFNCLSGKTVYLIASGPSADAFKDHQQDPDAIYVAINGAISLRNINFDFLFVRDFHNFNFFQKFIDYKPDSCKKFFGIQAKIDTTGRIPEIYKTNPLIRFFYIKHYSDMSFANDIEHEPFADFGSTVFSAMQFLLYTNPRIIYLVGCDCTHGYFYDKGRQTNLQTGLVYGWLKLRDFIKLTNPSIKIVSINPVGLKGMFEDEFSIQPSPSK